MIGYINLFLLTSSGEEPSAELVCLLLLEQPYDMPLILYYHPWGQKITAPPLPIK